MSKKVFLERRNNAEDKKITINHDTYLIKTV